MNRYLLFAGCDYYPSGGMRDFTQSAETLEELQPYPEGADWWHVVDSETGHIVAGSVDDLESLVNKLPVTCPIPPPNPVDAGLLRLHIDGSYEAEEGQEPDDRLVFSFAGREVDRQELGIAVGFVPGRPFQLHIDEDRFLAFLETQG